MQTTNRSATAYDRLSMLTEQWSDGQALIQDWRVLTRAIKKLAAFYGDGAASHETIIFALSQMVQAASIERNRLYVEAHRLGNEMDTLNHQIQNGVYNED